MGVQARHNRKVTELLTKNRVSTHIARASAHTYFLSLSLNVSLPIKGRGTQTQIGGGRVLQKNITAP